eukprot:CAMPEP_0174894976 /NCGR_PEP_ID=MMETSP0167-20121228/9483_1 /TAXON_ID=38298 /ORGANISM="Rhodella maculata, Strain CCMP736" /LENGTH=53 /DNA_ID=CAMNT_0016134195 /DNA_START=1319 /DNA_END=1480 /DNA_ORIENTATION=-
MACVAAEHPERSSRIREACTLPSPPPSGSSLAVVPAEPVVGVNEGSSRPVDPI